MTSPALLYFVTATGNAGVSLDNGRTLINHLGRAMPVTAAWTEVEDEPVLTPACLAALAAALPNES